MAIGNYKRTKFIVLEKGTLTVVYCDQIPLNHHNDDTENMRRFMEELFGMNWGDSYIVYGTEQLKQ